MQKVADTEIRIQGTNAQIQQALNRLKKVFDIIKASQIYRNTDSPHPNSGRMFVTVVPKEPPAP
jgi:hypothetical protein